MIGKALAFLFLWLPAITSQRYFRPRDSLKPVLQESGFPENLPPSESIFQKGRFGDLPGGPFGGFVIVNHKKERPCYEAI